ncbi:SusC/RagA family TonB-linked outer membrane protein [Bacteroides sp.]|uniref:SusC/RagA family TonB-linked outer membrane protein n=1 Tax=Bacteroides sp. TaxID=29523 RepID=UPI003AB2D27C
MAKNGKNRALLAMLLFLAAGINAAYASDTEDTSGASGKAAEVVLGSNQQKGRITIKGRVVDEKHEPVIGVNIILKEDKSVGAITDIDGNYTIQVPSKASILEFSYIGYASQEQKVGTREVIDIILKEDATMMDEVVVVGFGTQKKESVVGSISTIRPKSLQVGTSRSLSNNLLGQLSGVIGSQRSGEPGYDGASFFIRGISSFNGNNSPLILVDGIERSLDNIDPAEIESFSILKDAAASAVYGVRGANGVILINTKRGKEGKPSVDVRFEQGITFLGKLPKYVDAYNYASLVNEIAREEGKTTMPYSQSDLDKYRSGEDPDLYPNVNWIDEITKDYGLNSRVNLDVSGGSQNVRYSLIASYYNTKGILERDKSYEWDNSDKLNRFSLRSNVDVNLTKTTLLRVNIGGYMQDNRKTAAKNSFDESYATTDDIFQSAFATSPIAHPARYSTGEIPVVTNRVNPWAWLTQTGYRTVKESNIETLFSIEQDLGKLVKGLKVKGLFSFDRYSTSIVRRSKNPTYYQPATGRNPDGSLILNVQRIGNEFLDYTAEGEYGTNSTYTELAANYSNSFGKHLLQSMFMFDMRSLDEGDKQPFRFMGIAGRFSYTYDNKYVGEFNFGYNGSENFAKGKRFGFFPSVALGWIISEEKFMEPVKKVISKLKIRGSYGLVGNDCLGQTRKDYRFPYLTTIEGTDGYKYGPDGDIEIGGTQEGLTGSRNLTWEKVKKMNIGLELGIADAVNLTVDYFQDKRYDIFMKRVNIPSSVGFINNPFANFGKTTNRGIELSLEVNKHVSKDFDIMARGTFTYAKSRVDEMDEPITVIGTNRSRTGHPIGQLFGYIAEGLFTDDDFADVDKGILKEGVAVPQFSNTIRPGDIKYRDVNGDGVVNSLDESPIGGTWDPMLVYGFGLNLRYKQLDFGFFFQGNGETYRIIGQGQKTFIPGTGAGVGEGNIYSNYKDRWTPENPRQDVFWPRLSSTINENNVQPSTWWLRNMSVLRLKNVELGYSFSKEKLLPSFISGARVFVACSNPFEITKFKMWDPELDTSTGAKYPISRVVSFGFNISF